MFTIESVRIRNFRAIKEAYFKPLEEGITGIFGPNGAGKSTILHALLFALYGAAPARATIGSLRRDGTNPKNDECSVSVLFNHMGQKVEIVRSIKGANNTIIADIYVDGIPQTETSSKAASTWIAKRLGIDLTGFTTAFVIRQKELDSLVNEVPSKRKAVIEKLAGIDAINHALVNSRKEESLAKGVLENMGGSQEEVDDAKSRFDSAGIAVKNHEKKMERIVEHFQKTDSEYNQLKTALNLQLSTLNTLERNRATFNNNQALIDEYNTSMARVEPYTLLKKEELDIDGLRAEYKDINDSSKNLTEEYSRLQFTETAERGALEKKNAMLNELTERFKPEHNKEEAEKIILELETKIADTLEKIDGIKQENVSNHTRKSDLEESIILIHGKGDVSSCPTCQQDLAHPKELLESMNITISEYNEKIKINNELIKNDSDEIVELKMKKAELLETVRTHHQISVLVEEKNAQQKIVDSLPDLSSYPARIEELEVAKNEALQKGFKAKEALEAIKSYNETGDKLRIVNAEQVNLSDAINVLDKQVNSWEFETEKLAMKTEAAEKVFNAAASAKQEALLQQGIYANDFTTAEYVFTKAQEEWARKKDLARQQETRSLTTEVIEKFRKHSIASLTPELSNRATDLISNITNNMYTEVTVGEDFDITVKNSAGSIRKISELSGGEESAVAFALRLAVGLLITGGTPEFLFMDEVLTAQDTDRRASMLETIRALPTRQIMMINHTQDAQDIVDKSITVVPSLEGGSVLQDGAEVSYGELTLDDIPEEEF